jgi:HSP20 family protein
MAEGRDIDRLHDELEQLFDDLWRLPRFGRPRRAFRPHVDVFRTNDPDEVTVVVDLAGVDPDEVHVAVVDSTLVVAGLRPRREPECRRSYYRLEIEHGPFERRIALPDDVDAEHANAAYERGLLTIVIPVAAKAPVPVRASIPVTRR